MYYSKDYGQEIENLFHKVSKSKDLLHEFLYDILSPSEYKEVAVRWQIVKMIKDGVPHREIAEKLKVSVATVTRGSREVMNKKGGFNRVWEKFYK